MDHRKRVMRCEHPTPCDTCFADCKRAEITAKEERIKADLLAACEDGIKYLDANTSGIGLESEKQNTAAFRRILEAAIKAATT